MNYTVDEQTWFNDIMKGIAKELNYALSPKDYKKEPQNYKGHIGDVAACVRVAVCLSTNSPNLYQVLQILGEKEVTRRVKKVIE